MAQRDVAAGRDRVLLTYGAAAVAGFLVLRAAALYGDPNPSQAQNDDLQGFSERHENTR